MASIAAMPGREGERRLAALDRGDVGLERGARRVLRPRVLVALVLAELLLHVGRGLEDRRDDRAGCRDRASVRRECRWWRSARPAGVSCSNNRTWRVVRTPRPARRIRSRVRARSIPPPHVVRPPVPRRGRAPEVRLRAVARCSARCRDAVCVVNGVATFALAIALAVFAWRLFVQIKRRLLWRVRRKLILSYIFIGVIPSLLILVFFLFAGSLVFMNVSAYLFKDGYETIVENARLSAQAAAIEIGRDPATRAARRSQRVHRIRAATYPALSIACLSRPNGDRRRSAPLAAPAGARPPCPPG